MAAHALDDYYLGLTALITVVFQLIFFFIAFALQFDKVTGMYTVLLIVLEVLPVLTVP